MRRPHTLHHLPPCYLPLGPNRRLGNRQKAGYTFTKKLVVLKSPKRWPDPQNGQRIAQRQCLRNEIRTSLCDRNHRPPTTISTRKPSGTKQDGECHAPSKSCDKNL